MSKNPRIVTVCLARAERSYAIEIGTDTLSQAAEIYSKSLGAKQIAPTHVVVITDTNVEQPYAHTVAKSFSRAGADVDLLVIEPGERSKSIEVAGPLWERMLELGTDRKSVVVAVGGGVVGDLAGFIAATFARGIALFQVPTTLLAQVDSSVGGKVGINLPQAKNMVGAFWQPTGVLIDVTAIDSLSDRDYRAGLAEVVKYGVILDPDFFEFLENNILDINRRKHDVLHHVIARCCELKATVVEADEREETGARAVLNYGHTFCHAFETTAGYGELLHGEAVSIGMLCASRLAERLGRVDHKLTERQYKLLLALHLPVVAPQCDPERLLAAMMHDKKVEHGRLRFVLPTRLGHVELVSDVDPSDVAIALFPQAPPEPE